MSIIHRNLKFYMKGKTIENIVRLRTSIQDIYLVYNNIQIYKNTRFWGKCETQCFPFVFKGKFKGSFVLRQKYRDFILH